MNRLFRKWMQAQIAILGWLWGKIPLPTRVVVYYPDRTVTMNLALVKPRRGVWVKKKECEARLAAWGDVMFHRVLAILVCPVLAYRGNEAIPWTVQGTQDENA